MSIVQVVTIMPVPRVTDHDDPRRCIGTNSITGEQCRNQATEEGGKRCNQCAGKSPDSRKEMQDYLTEQFRRRMKIECDEGDEIKLLRSNLMDINAMIAAYRNKIKDDSSFAANSGAIADLAMKAEKLTATLHRLELQNDYLVARPALVRFGQNIVEIIGSIIEDKYDNWEDDLHTIATQIGNSIIAAKNEEGEKP